ncbi:MAG: hypothetical protein U0836_18240 [Pirellulales bacterium]
MARINNIRRLLRTAWGGQLQVFAQEVVAYFETAPVTKGKVNFDLDTPEAPGPVWVSDPLENLGLPEIDYDAASSSEALPDESFRSVATADGGTIRYNVSSRIRRSSLLGRVVRQDGDKSYTLDLFPFGLEDGRNTQVTGALEAANRAVAAGTMIAPVVRIDELEVRQAESYGADQRLSRSWVEVELIRRRHYFAPGSVLLAPSVWADPIYGTVAVDAGT